MKHGAGFKWQQTVAVQTQAKEYEKMDLHYRQPIYQLYDFTQVI